MKSDEYWAERMRLLQRALLDKGYDYTQNFEKQFALSRHKIEQELEAWYSRFAKNNEISLSEARKLLTSGELKELRWTVEEYIKYGKENALDGRWMKELENASARVHISRLEGLKLQIRQEVELLYGGQPESLARLLSGIYESGLYRTAFEIQKGVGLGCTLTALNENALSKVLARPWTTDGKTFRDRCWTNREALVRSLNTNLTQMIIRGEAPDRAIAAISREFDVSKRKAGRLVMTESAAFSSAAQRDCFNELGVEYFRILENLDGKTCEACGELDGKVLKMSEFEVGLSAPPFHPRCRGCTAPHFDDMGGERIARGADGKSYKVPADMTYKEWYEKTVLSDSEYRLQIKINRNASGDGKQFDRYFERLGGGAPKTLEAFQRIKYGDGGDWAKLQLNYADEGIKNKIRSDTQIKAILEGRQGKHIQEHNNYITGRSYITVSLEEAQRIVDKYAGTGKIIRTEKGLWRHQEMIYTDKLVGYTVNAIDNTETPTKALKIHYSKKGTHIVPEREG